MIAGAGEGVECSRVTSESNLVYSFWRAIWQYVPKAHNSIAIH